MTVMTVDDLILALEGKPGDALVFVQMGYPGGIDKEYLPAKLSTWSSNTPDLVFLIPDPSSAPVKGVHFEQGWRPFR